VLWVRFPHMLLAAYLTGAFCVAATGAWYLLRGNFDAEARIMLRMGLYLAAILLPVQFIFGHLNGDYIHHYQPAKFAAIEARWHDEQPAAGFRLDRNAVRFQMRDRVRAVVHLITASPEFNVQR